MRVTVEIREDAFRVPKTAAQIEEEIRQAAAMFWLARGDVTPEHARDVTAPPVEGAPQKGEPMLYDLLLLGPDVGEDADFERPHDLGRELPEWVG